MNNTTVQRFQRPRGVTPELAAWSVAFGILAVSIIAGNALAIAVLTRKRLLSRRTSYFLLSLSVADVLVGTLSVPMYIFQIVTNYAYYYTTIVKIIRASDVFCSLASTFTLTIIALERFFAITYPLKHRVVDKRVYYVLVTMVWILAGVLSSLYFLFKYELIDHKVFFYFMINTFFISLFIMFVAYLTIWFRVTRTMSLDKHKHAGSVSTTESNPEERLQPEEETQLTMNILTPNLNRSSRKSRKKNSKRFKGIVNGKERMRSRAESEKKLAVTLFIVTAVFVVTWLPFQVINLIFFVCRSLRCAVPSKNVIFFCKFLNYSNSLLNPVVYSLRLPEFRYVLKTVILKKFKFLFCQE